jgi:hypothetical protein
MLSGTPAVRSNSATLLPKPPPPLEPLPELRGRPWHETAAKSGKKHSSLPQARGSVRLK